MLANFSSAHQNLSISLTESFCSRDLTTKRTISSSWVSNMGTEISAMEESDCKTVGKNGLSSRSSLIKCCSNERKCGHRRPTQSKIIFWILKLVINNNLILTKENSLSTHSIQDWQCLKSIISINCRQSGDCILCLLSGSFQAKLLEC